VSGAGAAGVDRHAGAAGLVLPSPALPAAPTSASQLRLTWTTRNGGAGSVITRAWLLGCSAPAKVVGVPGASDVLMRDAQRSTAARVDAAAPAAAALAAGAAPLSGCAAATWPSGLRGLVPSAPHRRSNTSAERLRARTNLFGDGERGQRWG
jgi:hypothetical protein